MIKKLFPADLVQPISSKELYMLDKINELCDIVNGLIEVIDILMRDKEDDLPD